MARSLTIQISDKTFRSLDLRAKELAKTPEAVAAEYVAQAIGGEPKEPPYFVADATESTIPADQRFRDNGDNTVTDLKHKLMWIKNPGLLPYPIGEYRVPQPLDWLTARRICEELQYVGHSDWRLPTVPEWEKLADAPAHEDWTLPFFGPEKYLDDLHEWWWTGSESKRKQKTHYRVRIINDRIEVSGPLPEDYEQHVRALRTIK